jgi:hypothetical protein
VAHAFRAGRWRGAVSVVAGDGSRLHYALPPILAYSLTLSAPRAARYGDGVVLRARLVPALPGGVVIAGNAARRTAPGRYRVRLRITRPGPFSARFERGRSAPVWVLLKPRLDVRVAGMTAVGSRVRVGTRLKPRTAGTVRVHVDGRATNAIDTRRAHIAHVVVSLVPRKGWVGSARKLGVTVVEPALGPRAHGGAVLALEQRLGELHYALRATDGVYGDDDVEAVLAFQKVNGLARTGVVDRTLWSRLATASVPRARYGGTHAEIDKTRQVLFLVRNGKVEKIVHTSTGATGNTPVGLWHVYFKVPGWSWVLWYPSYFLRGFAVHGYPDVPAYPASHGCVRVPMWIAPQLYAEMPYGFPIYVYY